MRQHVNVWTYRMLDRISMQVLTAAVGTVASAGTLLAHYLHGYLRKE